MEEAPVRTVRILFFEGCPGHGPAVELVLHVAGQLGVPIEIEEVEVHDAAQAEALRFLGSPTVQVDGLDIEAAARTRSEYAMACRTYAGGSAVPPAELLRAAMTSPPACSCAGPRPLRISARGARSGANGTRSAGGVLASTGAVVTAVASTACCWLPPLLIAAGASAVGVAGFVERWRPFLAAAAVALLGCSFYAGYFRRPKCGCSGPTWKRRVGRITPWVASVIVVSALLFPDEVVALIQGRASTPAHHGATAMHQFTIEGMTCEACAATLQDELAGIDGVSDARVDFATRTAQVYASGGSIAPELVRVAERRGWKATPK